MLYLIRSGVIFQLLAIVGRTTAFYEIYMEHAEQLVVVMAIRMNAQSTSSLNSQLSDHKIDGMEAQVTGRMHYLKDTQTRWWKGTCSQEMAKLLERCKEKGIEHVQMPSQYLRQLEASVQIKYNGGIQSGTIVRIVHFDAGQRSANVVVGVLTNYHVARRWLIHSNDILNRGGVLFRFGFRDGHLRSSRAPFFQQVEFHQNQFAQVNSDEVSRGDLNFDYQFVPLRLKQGPGPGFLEKLKENGYGCHTIFVGSRECPELGELSNQGQAMTNKGRLILGQRPFLNHNHISQGAQMVLEKDQDVGVKMYQDPLGRIADQHGKVLAGMESDGKRYWKKGDYVEVQWEQFRQYDEYIPIWQSQEVRDVLQNDADDTITYIVELAEDKQINKINQWQRLYRYVVSRGSGMVITSTYNNLNYIRKPVGWNYDARIHKQVVDQHGHRSYTITINDSSSHRPTDIVINIPNYRRTELRPHMDPRQILLVAYPQGSPVRVEPGSILGGALQCNKSEKLHEFHHTCLSRSASSGGGIWLNQEQYPTMVGVHQRGLYRRYGKVYNKGVDIQEVIESILRDQESQEQKVQGFRQLWEQSKMDWNETAEEQEKRQQKEEEQEKQHQRRRQQELRRRQEELSRRRQEELRRRQEEQRRRQQEQRRRVEEHGKREEEQEKQHQRRRQQELRRRQEELRRRQEEQTKAQIIGDEVYAQGVHQEEVQNAQAIARQVQNDAEYADEVYAQGVHQEEVQNAQVIARQVQNDAEYAQQLREDQ